MRAHVARGWAVASAAMRVDGASLGRRVLGVLRLVAVVRADRYEVTNFYLSSVRYTWRAARSGFREPSVATAMTDDDLTGEPIACFALYRKNGQVLAQWHGQAARALLALGSFAGTREDSPFSGFERFDFERPQEGDADWEPASA